MARGANRLARWIHAFATLFAALVALWVQFQALGWLTLPQPVTIVEAVVVEVGDELPEGPLRGPSRIEYVRYWPAVIPVTATIVVLGGLLTRRWPISWVGFTVLLVFSLLFLFSSGAALLPAVATLFFLLVFAQVSRKVAEL